MPLKVRDGATLRTLTGFKVMDGTTLRTIRTLKVMGTDGVTLRTVAIFTTPLTVATPLPAYVGTAYSSQVSIGPITATPTGGTAPYTYVWSVITGSCTIFGGTTASASFNSPTMSPGQFTTATVRVTCSDSSGQSDTFDVALTFEFASPHFG